MHHAKYFVAILLSESQLTLNYNTIELSLSEIKSTLQLHLSLFLVNNLKSQENYICTVSSPLLIRPLPSKATSLIRPNFRCTEIVKYYQILSTPRKSTPLLSPLIHCRRMTSKSGELLYLFLYRIELTSYSFNQVFLVR